MRVRVPPVREKVVQAHIRALLMAVGGKVYTIGRPPRRDAAYKGTGQTPGIPDLLVHLPARVSDAHQLWVEVKAKGGKLSGEQASFRDFCGMAGIAHVVGGLDEVIGYLAERGYVDPRNVPHYRVRTGHGEPQRQGARVGPDQEVQ